MSEQVAEIVDKNTEILDNIEEKIINTVASSPAIFKSQQKNEPELSLDEKRRIVNDLLRKSHSQFLSKFGKFLDANLLNYFTEKSQDYEVSYRVNQLRRYYDNKARKIDRKNRRYEALKRLIEKGEYFSEVEMMKRNPLLYDNLIGKYLTEEEKNARDNLDRKNITFVNLLMEGIERDCVKKLKKSQEDAEDEVLEESDSDDDDGDVQSQDDESQRGFQSWGEMEKTDGDRCENEARRKINLKSYEINYEEQQVLRQEFITAMYQNFLDGKDTDFDYSAVDDNEVYDNVDLREQDEEEKYFDSESPEITNQDKCEDSDEESEDELDKYMRTLKEQTSERTTTVMK